jgi:site-specific DNA-methyltransferase (adenine-specific)
MGIKGQYGNKGATYGLKPKDLIGIPWMLAFALRADGWYLRQDIIWHKPNLMPESVKDRCTKAHEYIFLLSKNKKYYYDHEAIKEPVVDVTRTNYQSGSRSSGTNHDRNDNDMSERTKSVIYTKRNKRSVWKVATKAFRGAHFAVFPPDLIKPCILAGSPVGGTVLDPFGGSGTTACVALEYGRNAVLCELNPEYVTLAEERIENYKITVGIADERLKWL